MRTVSRPLSWLLAGLFMLGGSTLVPSSSSVAHAAVVVGAARAANPLMSTTPTPAAPVSATAAVTPSASATPMGPAATPPVTTTTTTTATSTAAATISGTTSTMTTATPTAVPLTPTTAATAATAALSTTASVTPTATTNAGASAARVDAGARSVLLASPLTSGPCPTGWTCADIGGPALAGGQTLSGGTWTVQGAGDLYGSSDQFHFVWQSVAGDGGVTARVVTQTTDASPYAKAGVMLRQDSSAGAPFYDAFVASSGFVDVLYRSTAGAVAVDVSGPGGGAPVYLKVARVGNAYTAYTSSDGLSWAAVPGSTVSIAMTGAALGGLAVASSNDSALETATIDSVLVSACPSGWSCADVGSPALPGGQSLSNGTWTVQGAGYGIFGSSDQFHYAWQTVAGDASISARVISQTNVTAYAKAGVMLRQDATPGTASYYAYIDTDPTYPGVNVEYRNAAGATTVGLANPGNTPPVSLKVARAGATYTTYTSADGVTWTAVPGSAVTFSATNTLLAGLAVTSDCANGLSTGTFDGVAVTSRSSGLIPWHPHQSVSFGGGLAASVDLADGHVDVSAGDLSVPGRRLGLALGHTWDSWLAQHGNATAAGPGWVSSLTPRMGGVLTQTVVYTDASGAQWDFPYQGAPNGSGPYTAYGTPPGQPWLLSTSAITGFVLTNYLSGESWSFDTQGRYTSATDAYGNRNTMTQGPSGSTAQTNSGGRALAFTYSNGLLSDAQSPLWQSGGAGAAGSQHVSYGYNAQGQLTTLTRGAGTPDALTATFGYSGTQLVTVTTPAPHAWSLGYDGQGRLTTITSPVSGTLGQAGYTPAYATQVTYVPGLTQVIRGLGAAGALTTTTTLDALGQATQTQDGQGHTSSASYDADHDVTSSSDANGNTTTYAYSYVGPGGSVGLLTGTTRPAVGLYAPGTTPTTSTVTNRYDPATYDLLETDRPEGGVTRYAYDGAHSPITTTVFTGYGNCLQAQTAGRTGAIAPNGLPQCTYLWRASVSRYDGYGERVTAIDGRGLNVTQDAAATVTLDPVNAPLYTRHDAYTAQGDLRSESTPPLTTTLNGVTTSGPVTTTDGYDGDGNQTAVTSANGNTTTMAYDHLGRQTSTTLPQVTLYNGSSSTPTSSTGYDADGNTIRSSNANGEVTTSSYDPWQRLVATTNPVSGTALYTYTATEQTATRDPQGNVTASQYDAAGRLTLTTDPSNNTTQYQYDAVGNTVAITGGAAGAATTVETRAYDARNEVATDTTSGPGLATALTTRTYYDGDGNAVQVQQPNGDVTYTTYTFADEVRTVEVDPAPVGKGGAPGQPRVDSYTYDAAGNQVTHLDADNRTDTTTPDAANRTVQDVATVPGPGGTAASGTVITTTNSFDPDGNTVSWTRQTQTQTGPVQTQTDSAAFDAADRLTSSTDNGLTTRYGYDAAGRQRSHTIVDGTTTVATTLDAEGRAIALAEGLAGSGPYVGRMGYNMNDLPITMTLPGGSGVREGLGYDPSSRLVTETLAGPSANTLGYTPIGGSVDSYDSYNMDGSRITTGPQGGQITSVSAYVGAIDPTPANDLFQVALYTDSNGAPGTLVASSASSTLVANSWNSVTLAATLAPTTTYWLMYNAAGSASQYDNLAYDTGAAGSGAYYSAANQQYGAWPSTFGASTSINYQYALYATLAGSAPPATILNSAYAYGYNPLNWTTSTTTLSGTNTLVHDARGRLTSESGQQVVATGGSYRWTYDLNGNLTTQLGDNGYPVTYTYTSATPNQLQTMVMGDGQPTTFYGYDGHGDTTAITNSLGAVNPAPKNALNTHMTYDSQARPVQITFLDRVAPSTTTITATVTLAYNPNGQRSEYTLAEPGQATLDEQFTYRSGTLGQLRVTKGGTLLYTDTYLYTDAGAPYELLRTNGSGATSRYWYEVDGRGNVVALTDINGKVVDRYAYDSWGELTSNDATDEMVPQQLRYAGYWYDEKLSWYWLSVRYYDPEIERFLQPDPSEQDGVRTYVYVSDNPIDAIDPSGLCHIMLHFQPAFNFPFSQPFPIGKHTYVTLNNNNDTNTYWLFEGTKHNGHILGGASGGPVSPYPQVLRRGSDPRVNSDPTNSVMLLSDSKNCSCYIQKFVANAKAIDNLNGGQGLVYENPLPFFAGNPLYPINSNAFAYTIVSHGTGINVPKTIYSDNSGRIFLTKPFQYRAQDIPGWGRDLLDPHWVAPS